MEQLIEYFRTNGTIYNKQNEDKWRELKRLLQEQGHSIGGIRCGSCRRKMYDLLMKQG